MIILHAGVYEKELFLWGERPVAEPLPHRQPGQKSKRPAQSSRVYPPFLPYDAGARDLAAALMEAGIDCTASKKSTGKMIAWLPTVKSKPIASSPLIAEPPVGSPPGASNIAPWTVTAINFTAEQAISVLCACVDKQTLAPGVIVGKDLFFWATAMRFAGALVAKQQFLPGIIETNGTYAAHWKPIFAGPDAERLTKLAQAMPHVCRALTRKDTQHATPMETPPEIPAGSLLTDFIDRVADSLAEQLLKDPQDLGLDPLPGEDEFIGAAPGPGQGLDQILIWTGPDAQGEEPGRGPVLFHQPDDFLLIADFAIGDQQDGSTDFLKGSLENSLQRGQEFGSAQIRFGVFQVRQGLPQTGLG